MDIAIGLFVILAAGLAVYALRRSFGTPADTSTGKPHEARDDLR